MISSAMTNERRRRYIWFCRPGQSTDCRNWFVVMHDTSQQWSGMAYSIVDQIDDKIICSLLSAARRKTSFVDDTCNAHSFQVAVCIHKKNDPTTKWSTRWMWCVIEVSHTPNWWANWSILLVRFFSIGFDAITKWQQKRMKIAIFSRKQNARNSINWTSI